MRHAIAVVLILLSGCGDDGESPVDAMLADRPLGADAAEPAPCPPACKTGEICEFMGCVATTGVCLEGPVTCDNEFDPVCGCDGITYVNKCRRALAGVRHAHRGECMNECVMTPRIDCCYDRADCAQGLVCYASPSCAPGGEGRCKPPPILGECWVDSDCQLQRCAGAVICPCGMTCAAPDQTGRCVP